MVSIVGNIIVCLSLFKWVSSGGGGGVSMNVLKRVSVMLHDIFKVLLIFHG